MVIYGKPIAKDIYKRVKPIILSLIAKNIIPTLAIILVGDDLPSKVYVGRKKKMGEELGINVFVDQKSKHIKEEQLLTIIENYNNDPNIHGIIVQLPLPHRLSEEKIINTIAKEKDVDGFLENSAFSNPLAMAVEYVLKTVVTDECKNKPYCLPLREWLKDKKIVVVGKGKSAGEPIYNRLARLAARQAKMSNNIVQLSRSSENPQEAIKGSDIVISCVGKKNIITSKNLKKGAILIGVGLHSENGKLSGDYNESEIKNIAAYYTPTPEGMGPVNVASLLENVVEAALKYGNK